MDEQEATAKFKPKPMAMSIALEAETADRCSAILQLHVLQLPALEGAVNSMLILRPLVIIAGQMPAEDLETLRTQCLDIAAELVILPSRSGRSLELELKSALRAATIQRAAG